MQGEAFTRLGFTDYFRVELAWAKLLGAVLGSRTGVAAAARRGGISATVPDRRPPARSAGLYWVRDDCPTEAGELWNSASFRASAASRSAIRSSRQSVATT